MNTHPLSRLSGRKVSRSSGGAALVEYGMVVGLISVLAIGSVVSVGDEIKGGFEIAKASLASSVDTAQLVSSQAASGADEQGQGQGPFVPGEVVDQEGSEGAAPVEDEEPDAEAAIMAWDMLVQAHPYGPMGYLRGATRLHFGDVNMVEPLGLNLMGFFTDGSASNAQMIIVGDQRSLQYDNLEVYCENDLNNYDDTWALPPSPYYDASQDETTFVFPGSEVFPFVSGHELSCGIRPIAG